MLPQTRAIRSGTIDSAAFADDFAAETFLFVHIRKTAGNSIQSVLRILSEDQLVALRKEQDGMERFGLRNPRYKIKKHSTLGEYRDALGDEQFRDLYKFTCVRNPWDRMVSYYFTPTQNPKTGNRKNSVG